HADAAVRDERDEPEGGEPAERLADGRARDVELLGELLLAEHGSRLELTGDDWLLDHERDVVGLGAVEAHSSRPRFRPARFCWTSACDRSACASSTSLRDLRRASRPRDTS